MPLLRSIATVGGFTMLSRIFGFARDILIANALGAGPVADAFFVAFKFPNLFRRLFAEGAFTAAFVPIFAGLVATEGRDRAWRFANEAFGVLFWVLLVLVVTLEILMPWVMQAFAPGFVDDPAKFAMTVTFARIVFPYLFFVSLVSLLAGVLNSFDRFAAAAATPILLNMSLIVAILAFTPLLPTAGHALSWGAFAAGIVQLAWLAFHARRVGLRLEPPRFRLTERVRVLGRRALPVAIGAGIYQINLLVDTILASLLPSGSVSYLFYADRVNQLPLGVIGVAVGTALLPLLSRQVRAGETQAALASQNRALEFALFLTLPAAAALLVIAEPIIGVLFQRGAFQANEVVATAAALSAMAVGLPAFMLVKALTPSFFAREDTKTPVKIAAVAAVANVVVSLLLMGPFLHVGLAMSMAISAWINCVLLAIVLRRRGQLVIDARLRRRLPRMLLATAAMAGCLVAGAPLLADWFAGSLAERAAALTVLVAGGLAVFTAVALASGAAALGDLRQLRRG